MPPRKRVGAPARDPLRTAAGKPYTYLGYVRVYNGANPALQAALARTYPAHARQYQVKHAQSASKPKTELRYAELIKKLQDEIADANAHIERGGDAQALAYWRKLKRTRRAEIANLKSYGDAPKPKPKPKPNPKPLHY